MTAAASVVSLVALAGWLFLNWRALGSRGLSFNRKAAYAAAWVALIAGVTAVFTWMGA